MQKIDSGTSYDKNLGMFDYAIFLHEGHFIEVAKNNTAYYVSIDRKDSLLGFTPEGVILWVLNKLNIIL